MLSIRTLTLAIAATAAFAPAAFAQDASGDTASGKRFSVVGGYSLTEPTRNPVVDGNLTKAEGEGTPTLSAAWNITDNIAVERSEEHTSELQSLIRTSYAVFSL